MIEIAAFLGIAVLGIIASDTKLRIIAGSDDVNDSYSYVVPIVCKIPVHLFPVAIQTEEKKVNAIACTSSLISDTWALTTGHCAHDKITITKHCELLYGIISVPQNDIKTIKILEAIPHPKFQVFFRRKSYFGHITPKTRNDIALLKLKCHTKPYAKLSAVDYMSLYGRYVHYVGFGVTLTDAELLEPKKTTEFMEMRKKKIGEGIIVKCSDIGANPAICISPKCSNRDQRAQKGDSGGALVLTNRIIGVCSTAGINNNVNVYYTPISPYIDWIQHIMNTNNKKESTID